LTLPEAETLLTDCVIRYHGDTKISEQAVLYVEFDTLLRSVGAADAGKAGYYWDEDELEYALTGNAPTYNWIIGGMNSFNLLGAAMVLGGSFATVLGHGPLITIVLGWMPLMFSVLFFAIPLGRLLRLQVLRQRQRFQRLRKQLFKAITRDFIGTARCDRLDRIASGEQGQEPAGEKAGTVQHLILNPRTGQVLYAVVSMGGFLGMGEKTLIVPWQALEVTRDDTPWCSTSHNNGCNRRRQRQKGRRLPPPGHTCERRAAVAGARHALRELV
jgi:hypothetical protein